MQLRFPLAKGNNSDVDLCAAVVFVREGLEHLLHSVVERIDLAIGAQASADISEQHHRKRPGGGGGELLQLPHHSLQSSSARSSAALRSATGLRMETRVRVSRLR